MRVFYFMEKEKEIWKDVLGYEGIYEVSNLGNVKSLNYNHTKKERILKKCNGTQNYHIVCLHKEGSSKTRKVHRLVALSLIPNPDNKPQVNHIDGDKQNNKIENLEWVNNSENQLHAFKYKLQKSIKGEKRYCAKLIEKEVLEIRISKLKGIELAKKYNISRSSISAIKTGRNWKHI